MRHTAPARTAVALVAAAVLCVAGALVSAARPAGNAAPTLILSIVGTSDLHGYFMERANRGGLGLFAGFVNNLRAARAADRGGVLLLDAGDTFQGGVESDLSEGAVVIDAYNALGYAALAVGNHEFDFGAADKPGARQDPRSDMRSALKARAAQAHFPFLAANLLDETTGRRVDWPNVRASTVVEAAGLRVGLIGVMTIGALRATLPLNVRGLRMAPLTETITAEARTLRQAGAQLVIVSAHAGGGCERFDNPLDLSTCDDAAEIFDVAREVPKGLIDAIVAGHTHAGLAHEVNGVPIVQSYWGGRAFGRIDLTVDRASGHVVSAKPFAPREICEAQDPLTLSCDAPAGSAAPLPRAMYEGRPVLEDAGILQAMHPALARVRALESDPKFTLKNPNRVQALIGTWARGNPSGFHRVDGEGYRWLAARLAELDALNPQVAARLATAFNGWQRLEPVRREQARAAVSGLAEKRLSRNLAEIVGNMLKG